MQISKVTVHLHVKKLCADGLVLRAGTRWRNLRMTPAGQKVAADPTARFHSVEALRARHAGST